MLDSAGALRDANSSSIPEIANAERDGPAQGCGVHRDRNSMGLSFHRRSFLRPLTPVQLVAYNPDCHLDHPGRACGCRRLPLAAGASTANEGRGVAGAASRS